MDTPTERWEYKLEKLTLGQDDLNKLGEEGWELAGVIPSNTETILGARNIMIGHIIFKRRKQ